MTCSWTPLMSLRPGCDGNCLRERSRDVLEADICRVGKGALAPCPRVRSLSKAAGQLTDIAAPVGRQISTRDVPPSMLATPIVGHQRLGRVGTARKRAFAHPTESAVARNAAPGHQ
jgi:hypothetical protein